MKMEGINAFLTAFNTNSYNRSQIGNSKQLITYIYDYLNRLNIQSENIELLISYIAYLNKDKINIPLFLELLNKSYSYTSTYSMSEVIKVVTEVHNIYYKNSTSITLEKYIHDSVDERLKKLFLNRNANYLEKDFNSEDACEHIANLKLAAAICLEQKEYKEFIGYINEFSKYQKFYSPLINFQTYRKVRDNIKGSSKLFWDIYFGNEYVVSLSKNNIDIKDIYKENIYIENQVEEIKDTFEQLDLFSYKEVEERPRKSIEKDIKSFQICTIYNFGNIPTFTKEKDIVNYLHSITSNKEQIILPKLKTQDNNYLFEYEN